jgi:2-C-methyl-D-erythritol 4-phosphate cytidylyltransferase
MGASVPKQFLPLGGKPILLETVLRFHSFSSEMTLVVVLPASEIERWEEISRHRGIGQSCLVVAGGADRTSSVRNGLAALGEFNGVVGVHDGVRPLLSRSLIERCFLLAEREGSAVPAVAVQDSLRKMEPLGSTPVNRAEFRAVQTPQCFDAENLREAYRKCPEGIHTDDASVFQSAGFAVYLCKGERHNIKITTPEDLVIAEALLASGQARF